MHESVKTQPSSSLSESVRESILALKYNGNVSQYGWVVDGKVIECDYNGCHSQILSYPEGNLEATWSYGPNIPRIRLEYIFSPSVSPWRDLLPGMGTSIQEIADGAPFVFNDLSLDANLLVNMMFSLRWPAEQIWSYTLWERLLHARINPAVADLITALVQTRDALPKYPYDPAKPRWTTTQQMHSNFVALACSMEYAENFVNGRMLGGNGNPFQKTKTKGCANDYQSSTESRGYKPVVGAFGKFDAFPFLDQLKGKRGEYMAFLEEAYGELNGFEHLVEIARAEQKRFKLGDWAPGQRFADKGVHETPNGVELNKRAIQQYENRRKDQSDWSYVQGQDYSNHAHAF